MKAPILVVAVLTLVAARTPTAQPPIQDVYLDSAGVWHQKDCSEPLRVGAKPIKRAELPETAKPCSVCKPWLVMDRRGEPPLTAALVRRLTAEAMADTKGPDPVDLLDKKMHALFGDFTTAVVPVAPQCGKTFALIEGPYARYRGALRDKVRKMEPIGTTAFRETVIVHVTPTRIDDPDVIKIVVTRGNAIVPPSASTLAPKVFGTALGARSVIIHAGSVLYPMSAFAPGAPVTVIAIPDKGTNCELHLTGEEVATIR